MESYDPSTDSWQIETSLSIARNWATTWVANGEIYVSGGGDGSQHLKSIEVYDPTTKQWSTFGNLLKINLVLIPLS